MNTKNVIIGGVAGFVFIFLYEWVVHGMLLMPTYDATASVWRPMAEMEAMMPYAIFIKLALAFATAYYVGKMHKHGYEAGACFGFMIGVFLAIMSLAQYTYLPIELNLPIMWAIAIIVQMTAVGAIAGHFNQQESAPVM